MPTRNTGPLDAVRMMRLRGLLFQFEHPQIPECPRSGPRLKLAGRPPQAEAANGRSSVLIPICDR